MLLCFHLLLHFILRLVMVHLHLLIVLLGVYFWMPSSTALGRSARTNCTIGALAKLGQYQSLILSLCMMRQKDIAVTIEQSMS